MTRIDEDQFDQLRSGLDRIGDQICQLTSTCERTADVLMGIQSALRDQVEAISMLTDMIAQPMKQMQADLSEIRAGVDDMR